ncbi:expressed unknown protein [Seminavis robusta]|uniref:Uncharacterized protein n=1 Tax=Seminavis robusta TaxID=568900 RepID=A0A9N8H579_9STRA|nr:expressed unknown protein [Seminavis robusta]|eukprot:Sro135_g063861.1  (114) ;mRNA; r:76927-77268
MKTVGHIVQMDASSRIPVLASTKRVASSSVSNTRVQRLPCDDCLLLASPRLSLDLNLEPDHLTDDAPSFRQPVSLFANMQFELRPAWVRLRRVNTTRTNKRRLNRLASHEVET